MGGPPAGDGSEGVDPDDTSGGGGGGGGAPTGTATHRYDAKLAGEYFTRDGNMSLLFTALGSILGQLGDSMPTSDLDQMFVADGGKVRFTTFVSGLPPTQPNGTTIGFMRTDMPWWFTIQMESWDARPSADAFGYPLDPTTAATYTWAEMSADYDDLTTFTRWDAEDYIEWYGSGFTEEQIASVRETGSWFLANGGDITDMSTWLWYAGTTYHYPDDASAPIWRAWGAKSISWNNCKAYLDSQSGFGTANYMTFVQTSELVNWLDTYISSDAIVEWTAEALGADMYGAPAGGPTRWAVQAGSTGTVETSLDVDGDGETASMVAIDNNMVLDFEEVAPVVPMGTWGAPRTNPYVTSTFTEGLGETGTDPEGTSVYLLETAPETIEMMKPRYRQLTTSKQTAADFIGAQSALVESTLYSSIGNRYYIAKMQKAQPMVSPYTISGDIGSTDYDSLAATPAAATVIEATSTASKMVSLDSDTGTTGGY